ncbi:mitoferrin-2-like [Lingula anatina]|uniref:Mitoferrin-2-like n=1 Tax=Lingula anatina TaxID=7574 RepID=A0A2R2MQW2_LINAN|nr:mitoferrin-2-like [Lingula anatina]|eukprot:XP_023932636.1 mitoferrin-2-like [Lingula anatina]
MEITEAEIDEYESLPPTSSMTTHMAAGALAGIMEHCVMYPVDSVKTRMMCLRPNPNANYRNLMDAYYTIVRYEGLRTTCRGVSAVIGGAGPAHAMYFACYEKLKWTIGGTRQGNPLANAVAGCAATLLHDAVMNPADGKCVLENH